MLRLELLIFYSISNYISWDFNHYKFTNNLMYAFLYEKNYDFKYV